MNRITFNVTKTLELAEMWMTGRYTKAELARYFKVTPSAAFKALERCKKEGLI